MDTRRIPLPLKARTLTPSILALVLAVIVCWRYPGAFFFIGEQNPAPRPVGPYEWAPTLLALTLAIGLAPRFDDWERYGTNRIRTLSLSNLAVTVLLPVFTSLATLLLLYPAAGEPPARNLLPLAGNVAVSALLASISIGVVGPLIGTAMWGTIVYALCWWQSAAPAYILTLPYTGSHTHDGALDLNTRWHWIIPLAVAATLITWTRRSIPIRITLRPPEE